ncbi:MAG TPA: PEP-CTERM sorting domain-containing protein [Longimicrobiales bacterium]
MRALVALGVSIAVLATASTTQAQSITPPTYTANMFVGQTITIHKTITLAPTGANLVDLFFLADNTGSMYGIISNAQSGATAILGGLPGGVNYNFGVGHYLGDPSEGGYDPFSYQTITPLTSDQTAAQAGINTWFASGGGDTPEANFYALQQVANTTAWRTGSQRLVVWFGDAPSHTVTTTQAQAIAAMQGVNAQAIAFNSWGPGTALDESGQATAVASATGGSVIHNASTLSPSAFASAVTSAISTASASLDLVFGSTLVGTGLTLSFLCTDILGCNNVAGGASRTFDVSLTANAPGTYDFSVFANGVAATEVDRITVTSGVVPEPSTWILLATGLFGVGLVARRRRRIDPV